MQQLTITEANALKAFNVADNSGKILLQNLFGADVFNRKITDRVKSWEDACAIKDIDPVKSLPYQSPANGQEKAVNAFFKITTIAEILNEGHVFNWNNSNEYKYYPYFDLRSAAGGFSFYGCTNTFTGTVVGARLCYRTAALATYAGKQFLDIYRDLHTQY